MPAARPGGEASSLPEVEGEADTPVAVVSLPGRRAAGGARKAGLDPPLDLAAHQHTLIDAAVATLQPAVAPPTGEPMPAAHLGSDGLVDAAIGSPVLPDLGL